MNAPNSSHPTSNSAHVSKPTASSAEVSHAISDGELVPIWRGFYNEACQRLAEILGGECHDSEFNVDARRIVEQAAGIDPGEFLQTLDEQPTTRMVAHFDSMLERRLTGEPLQYVLGSWSFRNLDLAVDSRVLIPRPETEIVAGYALAEIERIQIRYGKTTQLLCADMGTGSGAIALSLAQENSYVEVVATDLSQDCLAACRANLAGLGRSATRVQIRHGDWFQAFDDSMREKFALIVSNPPYIAEGEELPEVVAKWEPASALFGGPTGLEPARVLIDGALAWLIDGGALVLELGETQLQDAKRLALEAGYVDVRIEKDLAMRERVLIARKPGC